PHEPPTAPFSSTVLHPLRLPRPQAYAIRLHLPFPHAVPIPSPRGAPPPPPPVANLPCARRSHPLPARRSPVPSPCAAAPPPLRDGSPVERSTRRRSARKSSSGISCGRQSQGRRRTSSSGGGERAGRWLSVPTVSRRVWAVEPAGARRDEASPQGARCRPRSPQEMQGGGGEGGVLLSAVAGLCTSVGQKSFRLIIIDMMTMTIAC
ncbi:unnamed protein product, partial [Urochloa humidicola]